METRVVGLVADPEHPTEIAEQLCEELPDILSAFVSDKVEWKIHVKSVHLPLNDDGQIDVWKHGDDMIPEEGWDYLVCLTELTRRMETQFIISDVNYSHHAAIISLPALGPVRLRRNAINAIVRVLRALLEDSLQPERTEGKDRRMMRRLSTNVSSPKRSESTDERGDTISYLPLKGTRGRVRMLGGMVRINRPWRLVPSLSSAFAAAAAVAAFGIFYSSIWAMADSLSPARLTIVSLISIAAMVAWLTAYNGLWDKPKAHAERVNAKMYNAATLLTLTIGVSCFYILLFAATLIAAVAIIPPHFMETNLGHPVTGIEYVVLAWLSAAMGTIAGALGSSFENDVAIRQATYGRRELERYAKTHDDE